jgi:hypothetical protein
MAFGMAIRFTGLFNTQLITVLLGSSFQWQMFPFLWVPELFPPSATSFCNSQLIVCLQTLSQLPFRFLTHTLLTLTGNGSWSSLYSLRMDCTENTASNRSSVVACVSVVVFSWWLLSHCLARGVFMEPCPINSCLCWLHSTGFQQTCHCMFTYLTEMR